MQLARAYGCLHDAKATKWQMLVIKSLCYTAGIGLSTPMVILVSAVFKITLAPPVCEASPHCHAMASTPHVQVFQNLKDRQTFWGEDDWSFLYRCAGVISTLGLGNAWLHLRPLHRLVAPQCGLVPLGATAALLQQLMDCARRWCLPLMSSPYVFELLTVPTPWYHW